MTSKSIISRLKSAGTEEAVKAAYVAGFGLKFDNPLRADLYVPPVLFEFKHKVNLSRDDVKAKVLAQALYYIRDIRTRAVDVAMPLYVCVADRDRVAMIEVKKVIRFVAKDYDWRRAPSSPDPKLVKDLVAVLPKAVEFDMREDSGVSEFGTALTAAMSDRAVAMKRLVTSENFEAVYLAWKAKILPYIDNRELNAPWAFVQDACLRTVFNSDTGSLVFEVTRDRVQVSVKEYQRFWDNYVRPPDRKAQEVLLASTDRLAAMEKRRREGMFYTQEPFCSKALEYLDRELGSDWQDRYWIWDPCCGSGNLEVPLRRYDRLFMSTLDQEEVDYINSENLFPGATCFQYDFLNDGDDKLPQGLRSLLKSGEPVLVLMNPPYADAVSGMDGKDHKPGVCSTAVKRRMDVGAASRELSIQFLWRALELKPDAMVGMFSQLDWLCAPSFNKFKSKIPGTFKSGFLFHCRNFHGTNGNWPVAFSVVDFASSGSLGDAARFDVLDDGGNVTSAKAVHPAVVPLNSWFARPDNTEPAVPLSSAIKVSKMDPPRLERLASGALGYMSATGNDMSSQRICFMFSSAAAHGNGASIVPDNFERAMAAIAARKAVPLIWLNNRDQFSAPSRTPDSAFFTDCAVWNLFRPHNQCSSFTAEYRGRDMFIDNQFHPFSNAMAAKHGPPSPGYQRAVDRLEETWVCEWLKSREPGPKAKALLDAGAAVYRLFYANWDNVMKTKWRIENTRAGWYQVRNALEEAGLGAQEIAAVNAAAAELGKTIEKRVYSYDMLTETKML